MILRYFLLLLLLIHPPAFAASRVALVIGNSGYEQGHDLDGNPLRDAETMAAALRKVGFSVILKKDLSLSDMEDAVKSFGEQLDENTVALFYFSGHGVQRDGENYLIPLGAIRSIAAPGHLRDKTVNVNYVLSVMENAKSAVNLVFLDACRDNPFKGLFKGNATVGLATPKETPSGTLIAYATKAGGQSWTGEKGDNSPFVKVLAQEMAKPGLSITEMLTQVRSGVMKVTDNEQAPAYYNELNGTFCFVEPCGQVQQENLKSDTIESLVNFLAMPANADYSAKDWSSLDDVKEIKWKSYELEDGSPHCGRSFERNGKVKLQNLGFVNVQFCGVRSMMLELDIDFSSTRVKVRDENEWFLTILKSQFSKSVTFETVRKGCSGEDFDDRSSVYKVFMPSFKPLYVLTQYVGGGNTPGTFDFRFSLELDEKWRCGNLRKK